MPTQTLQKNDSMIQFANITATSYVKPYSPIRVMDNSAYPPSRWLCNKLPGSITALLPQYTFIDEYQVYQMSCSGWDLKYNNQSMYLSISMDGDNWTRVDTVNNASNSSVITRNITPVKARYVKITVTNGLVINPKLASITEFRVNEAAQTSNLLSNLLCSAGNLVPNFNSETQTYTVDVPSDVDFAYLIPTSVDSDAIIKVNNQICQSGQASQDIDLDFGDNFVSIVVTPKVGEDMPYEVNLIKQESQAPKLSNLEVSGYPGAGLTPSFDPEVFNYTSAKARPFNQTVNITATAEDSSATLTINGQVATSGQAKSVAISSGTNTITVAVTLNSKTTDYVIEVEK